MLDFILACFIILWYKVADLRIKEYMAKNMQEYYVDYDENGSPYVYLKGKRLKMKEFDRWMVDKYGLWSTGGKIRKTIYCA
jgi:hypothetical protein